MGLDKISAAAFDPTLTIIFAELVHPKPFVNVALYVPELVAVILEVVVLLGVQNALAIFDGIDEGICRVGVFTNVPVLLFPEASVMVVPVVSSNL